MNDPLYLAIDLKSFYASVECVERGLDPLKARLLVADESRTDKTICLAVSPALKELGVPGRPRLFEAKEKIGIAENRLHTKINYIIAPPRMSLYIQYSARVYSIYLKYFSAEDIHVYSIDEVFIDAAPYRRIYPCTPQELARRVIRGILEETGITATAGIGTNLYLAKIAMDIVAKHKEPDEYGVRTAFLTEGSYCRLLWDHMPITDFWQIAGGISSRLARYGILTMGDIAEISLTDEEFFYRLFGIDAELLIDHAWGIEPCTIRDIHRCSSASHSISNGQVLPRKYTCAEACLAVKEQAELLALQLTSEQMTASSLTLYIGYDVCNPGYDGPYHIDWYGRRIPKHDCGTVRFGTDTGYGTQIMEASVQLFARIANPKLAIRRIFLTLNHVRPESKTFFQLDLFHDLDALEREKRLERAVLSIKDRWGRNAILRGMSLQDGARTRERNMQIGGHRA